MKTIDLTSVIKTRNKIFRAATKAEKRVLIAKDVLVMLKNRKYKAKRNNFAQLINTYSEPADKSVQELLLDKNQVKCECCALGGLMTSCIGYVNDFNVGDYWRKGIDWNGGRANAGQKILQFFSKAQLVLIEIAFERANGYYQVGDVEYGRDIELTYKAEIFAKGLSASDALTKIMKNIIDNNGTFVP